MFETSKSRPPIGVRLSRKIGSLLNRNPVEREFGKVYPSADLREVSRGDIYSVLRSLYTSATRQKSDWVIANIGKHFYTPLFVPSGEAKGHPDTQIVFYPFDDLTGRTSASIDSLDHDGKRPYMNERYIIGWKQTEVPNPIPLVPDELVVSKVVKTNQKYSRQVLKLQPESPEWREALSIIRVAELQFRLPEDSTTQV